MKYSISAGAVGAFAVLTVSAGVQAATERQLDSHDHGHAMLNIAVTGDQLLAELLSPAANVVGFEHQPENDADHAAIEAALDVLHSGDMLQMSAGAGCVLEEAVVQSALLSEPESHDDEHKDGHDDDHKDEHDDEHKDEHHGEHKDGHDDEHKDGHDDEHKDGHDDGHKDEHDDGHKDEHDDDHGHEHGDEHKEGHDDEHAETHSEFHVTWSYSCENPGKLDSIDVKLFDAFSGFEEVEVSVAAESGQLAAELTAGNTVIEF